MSQQETHIGILLKIDKLEETSVEEWCKEYCIQNNKTKEIYYDSWTEYFSDELRDNFIVVNNNIYKIIQDKEIDDDDIFEAHINEFGQVEYLLSYYTGGCGFSEALEEAVRNMEERK